MRGLRPPQYLLQNTYIMPQSYSTQLTLITGSMTVSFAAGQGFIEKIQAVGPANETSSIQSLSTGDVRAISTVTASLGAGGLGVHIDVPNGSVLEGPFNEIKGHANVDSRFLVFYQGRPTIT